MIFLACFTGRGQSQQYAEALKKERQQQFAAVHTGDSVWPIDACRFKAAVVVFYKTDCPFCEKLMPEIKELHNELAGKGFEVYAICLDENTGNWKEYANSNLYEKFRNYCDGLSYAGKMADAYHVFATPSLFLIDSSWQIAAKPKGLKDLKENIELLCSK